MITKWRLNTRAVIRDGNLGRSADILQGKEVILEVFSKGTAATGWEEVETTRTDKDGVSFMLFVLIYMFFKMIFSLVFLQKEHVSKRDEKRETEWVDRVEFRLSVGGQVSFLPSMQYSLGLYVDIRCCLFTVLDGMGGAGRYALQPWQQLHHRLTAVHHHDRGRLVLSRCLHHHHQGRRGPRTGAVGGASVLHGVFCGGDQARPAT